MQNSKELFETWYIKPLRSLENISNGAGAFIALATSCFLYERFANAKIRDEGKNPGNQAVIHQLMRDFGVDKETATTFWNVMRNGILHQGMPKQKSRRQKLTPWRFLHEFSCPMELHKTDGATDELRVQPWLFMNEVIRLWQENLDLLDRNDSFPWARIVDD
jgi:hypothetical protein